MTLSNNRPRPTSPDSGFVLPVTLWTIAIVGLVVAVLNVWVSAAVSNAQILQRKAGDDLAFANITNEVVYLMASRPLTYRGLEIGEDFKPPSSSDMNAMMSATYETSRALPFDGRPFTVQSDPDYAVMIQDSRGLVNLNAVSSQYLRRLLSQFQVPDPVINRMSDTLQDYIDEDDYTRLSGAEKADYLKLGRAEPANTNLITPFEAQSILGWDMAPALWEADMTTPLFTTCETAGFNPNTASELTMYTYVQGLTKDNAAGVQQRRAQAPFRNAREFSNAAGVLMINEPFFFSFVPGLCVVVELFDRVSSERQRFAVTLTPFSLTQPWRIDYAFRIPAKYNNALARIDPQIVFPTPEEIDLRERGNNRVAGVR